MSTKSTIVYGPNFHFYHELMDDDHVYLQLETTQFEAGYGRVTVPIPIHIWETIRHLGGARLDLADKTDQDLLRIVESEVDQRIHQYQEDLRQHPDRPSFMRIAGALAYGMADDSRESQIEQGMEYHRRERKHQQEIQTAIASLRDRISTRT